jgi:actin cytoskeleton-regulatory complex protein SLA1
MGFLGIYKAVYDYAPQSEGELQITEGDVLYVLDKNADDDWWKAKKKAGGDEEDEPTGLIPNNYVEEVRFPPLWPLSPEVSTDLLTKAPPLGVARALYEYTRQTDEELSFPEDAALQVFDISDPDWILVGLDGEYGFVPANYIEISDIDESREEPEPSPPMPPSLPARPVVESPTSTEALDRGPSGPATPSSPVHNPAAALASVMGGRAPARDMVPSPIVSRPVVVDTPEASDEEEVKSPALPVRPRIQTAPRIVRYEEPEPSPDDVRTPRAQLTPGGFHMYNINEMVSVMGKRKKMPTTLGINLGTGNILLAPERVQDGPSQEWTADRMTHYSREGKHVFLELVRPSKSVDLHAGAKDTAEEIVSALGELAGAIRAEGLREVIMAGTGQSQKRGQVLYDFMAQGDDEVTVAVGDEVIITDDTKSDEWWQVRRLKNGKEGVVPSSYVEVTGVVTPPPTSSGLNAAKSTVEQNRLEEIRLTKEAVKVANQRDAAQQVGPGMPLPERGSSLTARENGNNPGQQRGKRDNGQADRGSQAKSSKSSEYIHCRLS